MDRSGRALAAALGLTLVGGLPSSSFARADDLPVDDGAPPAEYVPNPEAPAGGEIRADLTAEGPQTPPADNAFPIAGRSRTSCTDSFGEPRGGGRTHMGVDCFAPLGTPLVAAESGWIRYATKAGEPYNCTTGTGDFSGNRVSLRGRSGYVYYYGHLDSMLVAADQPVERGQVIGTVGSTGNATCSSPHLHLEVKCSDNGEPFDPYLVIGTWTRTTPPPARWESTDSLGASIAYSGAAREDLIALRCGRDLLRRVADEDGLSAWSVLEGIATSDPDLASAGEQWTPQVFARGTDGAAWHLYESGGAWTAASLGGICSSGPSAAFADPDHLDVFCRGSDLALWRRRWARPSGWTGWERVGGIATSDPDVVSPGPGYLPQVVARGRDDAVWHVHWDGAGWRFDSLGGTCSSGPSAAFSGPDRLDVFCRGGDAAIWHKYWNRSAGWSGWERIGGIAISDPDAASPGAGSAATVVARGLDRRMYEFIWTGRQWTVEVWGLT